MKPLISVIIPFYNNLEWLCEAIDSVISQTYDNIEILVINDGSNENMSIFLEKYRHKIKYIYQENKGAAAARNLGIEKSIGEYIAFLDSDDIWNNKKLEKQLDYMILNNLNWSHTSYSRFNDNNQYNINTIDVALFEGNIFPICIISCPIATPCVMVKANILKSDKSIRFSENMISGEDTYLWMKIANMNKIGVINEPLTRVRIRGKNAALLAYSQIRARSQLWKVIKKDSLYIDKLSNITKVAFKLCDFIFNIIENISNTLKLSKGTIEVISKILYLLPWVIFKIEKHNMLKGTKNENS